MSRPNRASEIPQGARAPLRGIVPTETVYQHESQTDLDRPVDRAGAITENKNDRDAGDQTSHNAQGRISRECHAQEEITGSGGAENLRVAELPNDALAPTFRHGPEER